VYDIAAGICLVAARGAAGEAYNLGNPRNKTTILALARAVNRVVGNDAGETFVDPRDIFGPLYAEAADKYPHSGKAMRELEWDPRYGIEETIINTCTYMRQEVVA
jgi:nucleoside-diphosphate-sugar epimerase